VEGKGGARKRERSKSAVAFRMPEGLLPSKDVEELIK
jgi:hypothetical protein